CRRQRLDNIQTAVAVPVLTRIEHAVAVFVLAALDGNIANLEKAAPNLRPSRWTGKEHAENEQEAEQQDKLKAHHDLERVVNLAAKDERHEAQDDDGATDDFVEPPVIGDGVVLRKFAAEQKDFHGNRGTRRQIRKHNAEIQQQIDAEPEPGARQRAKFAAENRLAAIQRVAADFDVVESLK